MPLQRPSETFQPYVPASRFPAEFTIRAIGIGALFGVLFGASTVYLGLRAGLTVSASIPIAVLSTSVLRFHGETGVAQVASAALFLLLAVIVARAAQRKVE